MEKRELIQKMYKIEELITGNLHELENFLNNKEKENYSVVNIIISKTNKMVTPGVSIDIPKYIIIFKYHE